MADLRYFPICEPCVRGEGSECHTPECALWMRDVPPDGLIRAFAVDLAAVRAGVTGPLPATICDRCGVRWEAR